MAAQVQLESLGFYCTQAGIFQENLIHRTLIKLTKPVSKGIAYELNTFRVKHNHPWDVYYEWIKEISMSYESVPSLATMYLDRMAIWPQAMSW